MRRRRVVLGIGLIVLGCVLSIAGGRASMGNSTAFGIGTAIAVVVVWVLLRHGAFARLFATQKEREDPDFYRFDPRLDIGVAVLVALVSMIVFSFDGWEAVLLLPAGAGGLVLGIRILRAVATGQVEDE